MAADNYDKIMTSRERVLCALNQQEPDPVPIFFGASGVTTMNKAAYDRMKAYSGSNPGRNSSGALCCMAFWMRKSWFVFIRTHGCPILAEIVNIQSIEELILLKSGDNDDHSSCQP
jgi:hypothetical protein